MTTRRFASDRLLAFGDAVVAIAVTLLSLPLVELVPDDGSGTVTPRQVITDNLVPIGSFLLTFFVIWRIWWVHHELFSRVSTLDPLVMRFNVLWLLSILVLPFPAQMVAVYGDEPLVLALYVGVLLISSLSLVAMALGLRRLGHRDVGVGGTFVRGLVGNCACLAIAFGVVLVVPSAGYWPLLLLLLDGPILAAARRLRGP
ncbi:MAG: TMEM175 family protein [Nocardioides sp.]|uniref:TMEM175 family protein n=1 Tax=Nocardioides sp. TaxID=35761 RepID=UPI0039E244C9